MLESVYPCLSCRLVGYCSQHIKGCPNYMPPLHTRIHGSGEDKRKAAEILNKILDLYPDELTPGVVDALIDHLRWIRKG